MSARAKRGGFPESEPGPDRTEGAPDARPGDARALPPEKRPARAAWTAHRHQKENAKGNRGW